jgi:hypothetical protein
MKLIAKHSLIWIIIFVIFFSSFSINAYSYEEFNTSDIEDLAFKQELYISIDTSLAEAKFQPIDIHVDFDQPCWAKSETDHSLRVCYDDGSGLNEIESQIYDLEYQDEAHIKSCNLVFLIPETADGNEKYFTCYDSSKTKPPEYTDHIVLEDTHYFYEPIPGQKVDFDYYQIKEDGYIIYAVIQKGELLENPVALAVAKFKLETTAVETDRIDQLGIFDMRYGLKKYPWYYGSSWAQKVNKRILADGNLMVRMRIECISPRGDVKTDNIYTYYYCPGETKRICVNTNHEVIKTHEIEDPTAIDGAYAGIVTIKSRSASIEKMNVGNILPLLSIYGEDSRIKEFNFPQDPDSVETEYILTAKDDCDLGERAWACLSDPSSGRAHALIFNSNIGLVEGKEDGIQAKAFVIQNIKLPGLEADSGTIICARNAYEKGREHNTVLSKGFNANFDVKFISFEKGGHTQIDSESQVFQTLVKDVPLFRRNESERNGEEARYSLTTYVHFAPSMPLGSLLSAALGRPFSYIYAEIYKNDNLRASGSVGRLSLKAVDFNLDGMNLLQKIGFVLGLFDLKNASFFKKIKFPDLEAGTYVVKIFRENPFFAKERQYIGCAIVELKNDDKVHINCRPEGSIRLSISDQNDKGVENVGFLLERDGITIADAISDKNGIAILKAPCYSLKPYILKVIHQGFLIEEKKITLGLIKHLIQLKESFSIEHYKLNLKLMDTWGFAPAVEVNPTLTSSKMVDSIHLSAEKTKDGEYLFTSLYPAKYTLFMSYKSFDLEKDVSINKYKSFDLMFPAEYELDFDVMNSYGDLLSEGEISVSRNGKVERESIGESGEVKISVPPGKYEITVYLENEKIAEQKIEVRGNKKINILTSQESIFHTIIIYLCVVLAIFSIIFILWRKKIDAGIKLFAIALLIIALVSPWWVLNGDKGATSTTTKTLLVPSNIVTLSSSSEVLGGDVSQVPPEVTMVLSLLSILLAASCLIIFITIFTKNKLTKTTKFLSILSIVILIVTLSIFFYAMSQIAEVGVGSFIGSSDLETSLPGIAESKILPCNWGPGVGFYLGLITVIILAVVLFYSRIKTRFSKR